jgi:hypothetical protein
MADLSRRPVLVGSQMLSSLCMLQPMSSSSHIETIIAHTLREFMYKSHVRSLSSSPSKHRSDRLDRAQTRQGQRGGPGPPGRRRTHTRWCSLSFPLVHTQSAPLLQVGISGSSACGTGAGPQALLSASLSPPQRLSLSPPAPLSPTPH